MDNLNEKIANPTVTINAGNSLSIIDRIRNFFDWITGRKAEATVNVDQTGNAEVGHNANGTNNWKGGLTYINEDEKGELVDLPSGTRVIPHDLSEKMIEEEAKNSNKGNITVNNIDIYQGKENETGTLDVDKADTIDKPYTPEVDTSGMSEDEKKAYDEKKKAEEDEEKRLKDKADKEKQYLDDIGSYWDTNSQSIQQSIKEIELKEAELGDNASYTDKMDLLNQKYQRQLDLLPEAEKQLNTYKNTTVTTEEAQKELSEKIKDATETLIDQKKAIADAYKEMKELAEEEIEKLIEKEKELKEKQAESSNYSFSKNEYKDYIASRKEALENQISDLEDLKDEASDTTAIQEDINQKQSELNDLTSENYETVKNTQKTYEDIQEQRKADLQDEIDTIQDKLDAMEEEKQAEQDAEDLAEKKEAITEAQNTLTEKQIELEKLKNQKTIQSYQQQADGTWQFTYTYDKSAVEDKQDEVDDAQSSLDDANEALDDYEEEQAYNDEVEALQKQQDLLKQQQDAIDDLTETKSKSYQEDLDNVDKYYDDMDKRVDERFEQLKKTYGDNWTEMIGSVETQLQSAKTQLDELTKIDLTYKVDVSSGVSSSDSSNSTGSSDSTSSSSSGSNAITEVVKSQFDDVKEYGAKITEQKINDESDMLNEQESYQKESIESSTSFLEQQNNLYNTYLELLQNILDWRYGNFVEIASLSTEQIIKLAEIQGEAYNKYVEMYNEMSGEDGDKLSEIDLSSLYDSYNEYKSTSLADYVSDKADLYDISKSSLYSGATASSLDVSSYLNNNGYSVGNSSSTGTTSSSSSSAVNNYYISGDISLPSVTDAESFVDGVVSLANQKNTVKS
ncbi:MAG TPA: hypothetical protein DCW51_06150 [Clostridium sp.]|nr:hypothetical protein [Clostridium sp.]